MIQLLGITSNLRKQEAEAQGGVLPGAQLMNVQPQSHTSASLQWEKEGACGSLHYQSKQTLPTGVLLIELGSVSAWCFKTPSWSIPA